MISTKGKAFALTAGTLLSFTVASTLPARADIADQFPDPKNHISSATVGSFGGYVNQFNFANQGGGDNQNSGNQSDNQNNGYGVRQWSGTGRRNRRGEVRPMGVVTEYSYPGGSQTPVATPAVSPAARQDAFNGGGFGGGFGGGLTSNPSMDAQTLISRMSADPTRPQKPDKFADNPMTDGTGVRHFGNGRHYDLQSTTIEEAVNRSMAEDQATRERALMERERKQQAAMERRQRRMGMDMAGF